MDFKRIKFVTLTSKPKQNGYIPISTATPNAPLTILKAAKIINNEELKRIRKRQFNDPPQPKKKSANGKTKVQRLLNLLAVRLKLDYFFWVFCNYCKFSSNVNYLLLIALVANIPTVIWGRTGG